jgi:hypothetical protein
MTERGPFLLSTDIVSRAYVNARTNGLPAGAYTKELPLQEKVILSPNDAPELFKGQPNCMFQALSEVAVRQLLRTDGRGRGRGGKEQAARKAMVMGWLDSEVFPQLRSIEFAASPSKPRPTAASLREQAAKLLEAADALDALETAQARAKEALSGLN